MMKYEHWDEKTMLRVEGNIIQVSADIGLLVHLVWEDLLPEKGPVLAEEFKRIIQSEFEDDSLTWMETDIQPDVKLDKNALGLLEMLKRKKEAEAGESGT